VNLSALHDRGIPIVSGFAPIAHTSRHGWLARHDCYPQNPFSCDPDHTVWDTSCGPMNLRAIARRVWRAFRFSIARVADPASYAAARAIILGSAPSWLDVPDRPAEYDDLGRGASRRRRRPIDDGNGSRYEQVILNAIRRVPLELDDGSWLPESVMGWSRVMFRRLDGRRRVITLDRLVEHLDRWHP
jgi:hypothetical protein